MHFAGLDRSLDRFVICVCDHEHRTAHRILRHHSNETATLAEIERVDVERHVPGFLSVFAPSICLTSRASAALVAIAFPPCAVRAPVQSVRTPPASSMIGRNAATSHSETTGSTITSALPV